MELEHTWQQNDYFRIKTEKPKNIITLIKPRQMVKSLDFNLDFLIDFTKEAFRAVDNIFDLSSTLDDEYRIKEKEWHKLVGKKNLQSLNKELRDFLINGAGMIDLGFTIDIEEAYKYPIYDK